MKTPFSWRMAIVATVAAVVVFGFGRPSHAQPQQNPAPAPPQNPASAPAPAKHTVTVHFDYDFNGTPPCPQEKNKPCVDQFIVYDISTGDAPDKRFKLFTVAVPPGAKGAMKGITGTSPPISFQSGRHLIAVTAQMPDKKESNPSVCQFWVTIP